MECNENNKCTKLASKFMTEKARKAYYEIIAQDDETMEELIFLQELSEEEIAAFRELREQYGKEGFLQHLDEVITDPDELHDLSCGCEILQINLDKPFHQYRFSRHELQGDQLLSYEALVELTDEMYIRLLALCLEDKDMNMNKLRYADKAIYNIVAREVDNYLVEDNFYMGDNPYLITMDEVKEDASRILEQNPELSSEGTMGYLFV